jgi:Tol biopolymer transport system component
MTNATKLGLAAGLCALAIGPAASGPAGSALAAQKAVMLMNRIGPSKLELYIAHADGTGERRLLPDSKFLDYDPSFSPDGQWIVFTSERSGAGQGQADLWRVHPDGTGLERLTADPSVEDAGVLSPDGTKLAYVSTKGGGRTTNIWVLDLNTKQAKNLTWDGKSEPSPTMNSSFRPSWSPDGQWIAFSSDRGEKWAGAEQGAGVGHTQPLSLYIIHPDGTGLRRITTTAPALSTGEPRWTRDGKSLLAYEIKTPDTMGARFADFAGPYIDAASQIVRIDVATEAEAPVTSGAGLKTDPQDLGGGRIGYLVKGGPKAGPGQGLAYADGTRGTLGKVRTPSWSPDGKEVVYTRYDMTNRAQYSPLYSWDPARQYRYTDVFPTLCKKTGKLAITDLNFPFGNPTASLSVMNPDGSDRKKIFQRPDGAALMPSWSPDCQWLAVGFGTFFGGRSFRPANIMLVKADGTETKELTQGALNIGFPAWSPDGKTIIFRVWGKENGQDVKGLRAMTLDDHKVKILTTTWDNFPFYSPSGDRVVFTRQMPNADFEVFTMKPDGTDQRRLTYTAGADAHATWSEDGQALWFESSRSGFKDEAPLYDTSPQPYAQVFLMNRDGSNVRQMTDSKWEDSMGTYLPAKK